MRPKKTARYTLERQLPTGEIKATPDTVTLKEAGQFTGMCLFDNGVTSKADAQKIGRRLELFEVGEWLDTVGGYRFRILAVQ